MTTPKPNKLYLFLVILVFPILTSFRLMRPGYFSMQDDMHVFRLQQFDQCIKDGQIPCRLISEGGLGYGYPLFNYYSPLPYAFAETIHLTGFNLIDSLKISFITPNFIRSTSMYLLGTSIFGPAGGLISSALYTFAPYMALNGYVRGALAELWALSLLPLIFWAIQSRRNNLFIISLSALFLSHNLTTLYSMPALLLFSLISKKTLTFIKNSLLSFLISSFFLLPAVFEKNLVTINTMTQGYFYYIIHFATISQLFFSRFWGYGASLWGPKDDMSFQIGYAQWFLPLLVSAFIAFRPKIKHKTLILSFTALGVFAIFLTHNRSTFLWQLLPFMAFYQFPWRFLGLVTFCFSFVSGSITNFRLFSKYSNIVAITISVIVVLLNIMFFKEDIWYPNLNDSQKLSSAEVYRQSGAGLKDYWPTGTSAFPTAMASMSPGATQGQIETTSFIKKSNFISGIATVSTKTAKLILPVTNFPNWKLVINGKSSKYEVDPVFGQILIPLTYGTNHFELFITNTPIRTIGNLLSLLGLSVYLIKVTREKHL